MTELVVSMPVVLIRPVSAIEPVVPSAVRLTAPAAIVPVMLIAPVLITVSLPVAKVLLMPAIFRLVVVLLSSILPPEELAALKLPIVLAPFNIVPPTELVLSRLALSAPWPDSEMMPPEINDIGAPKTVAPPIVIAPAVAFPIAILEKELEKLVVK